MTDKALANAEARRAELTARLQELEREAESVRSEHARVEAFIRDWHAFAAGGAEPRRGDAPAGNENAPVRKAARYLPAHRLYCAPAKRVVSNPRKEEVAAAARDVIREAGHPMIRPDLMRALRERGVVIEGTNPDVVLSTMLHRTAGLVKHLKGFGYWLHDEPYPPAGYRPGQSGNHPPASQKGRDLTDESTSYEPDERVEARRSESGPWEEGRIASATMEGTGWMVQFAGEYGTRQIPAARIRPASEGGSALGRTTDFEAWLEQNGPDDHEDFYWLLRAVTDVSDQGVYSASREGDQVLVKGMSGTLVLPNEKAVASFRERLEELKPDDGLDIEASYNLHRNLANPKA